MSIRILGGESKDAPVANDLLISTIEKNRDRIRTTSGMLISAAGILISACLGILLFTTEKRIIGAPTAWCFVASLLSFLLAAAVAVLSSVLKTDYAVSSEAQFVTDLLKLFQRELWLSRFALFVFLLGLALAICGGLTILARIGAR